MSQYVLLLKFTEGLVRWLSAEALAAKHGAWSLIPRIHEGEGRKRPHSVLCLQHTGWCLIVHFLQFCSLSPLYPSGRTKKNENKQKKDVRHTCH